MQVRVPFLKATGTSKSLREVSGPSVESDSWACGASDSVTSSVFFLREYVKSNGWIVVLDGFGRDLGLGKGRESGLELGDELVGDIVGIFEDGVED